MRSLRTSRAPVTRESVRRTISPADPPGGGEDHGEPHVVDARAEHGFERRLVLVDDLARRHRHAVGQERARDEQTGSVVAGSHVRGADGEDAGPAHAGTPTTARAATTRTSA